MTQPAATVPTAAAVLRVKINELLADKLVPRRPEGRIKNDTRVLPHPLTLVPLDRHADRQDEDRYSVSFDESVWSEFPLTVNRISIAFFSQTAGGCSGVCGSREGGSEDVV